MSTVMATGTASIMCGFLVNQTEALELNTVDDEALTLSNSARGRAVVNCS